MTVDPAVLPGLLLLAAELIVLAAIGFVVVRVALRQDDDRAALAQGLVVGFALWGVVVNLVMHLWPGLAGALAGWEILLAIGAGLAWRAPHRIQPRRRVAAGMGLAMLVLLPIALASRQLLSVPDAAIHLGMAASIRAGGFPPEFHWLPGMPAPHHYGTDRLVGLLTPPVGPDPASVTELLGAYAWTSFVPVVATALPPQRGWTSAFTLTPLPLTTSDRTPTLPAPTSAPGKLWTTRTTERPGACGVQ